MKTKQRKLSKHAEQIKLYRSMARINDIPSELDWLVCTVAVQDLERDKLRNEIAKLKARVTCLEKHIKRNTD